MTISFDSYPVGREILFVRATLDDVRWFMSEHPTYWTDFPGSSPFFRVEHPEIQFREFFCGKSSPSDWLRLFQPQNYDKRFFFIDVAAPGWIAVIIDSTTESHDIDVGRGLYCAITKRDGFPVIDDSFGNAQIHVRYRMLEPRVEHGPFWYGDRLEVAVSSTTVGSPFVDNISYVKGIDWSTYEIGARGLPGFDGIDLPYSAEIPEHVLQQYPRYLDLGSRKQFDLGPMHLHYETNPEASADFLRVLPFDHRGHDRIVNFFNTTLVAEWLEGTYGIRWDDPSFYEGESLLYIVGGPDGIKDPFTPRIPLEDYYRFQGIDLERNRALLASGKF